MRNAQASPTLHQIDAALLVSCLQRAHHGRHVDAIGQPRQQRLLGDRLGAGKDDRLRHAHRLGDMQPPRRVVALVALARVVLEQEGNDLCVAAFTHWITSEIAAIAGVLRPAAEIERLERRLLADLDGALAHHFEARGERAGDRRRPFFGRRQIVDQEAVERGPVLEAADQPRQDLAGLLERPDAAPGDAHIGDRLPLPLRGIGGQQVVEAGRIGVALFQDHRFRHAALEDVAAEPVAVDQARRRVAHRLQPLQAELQHRSQFLAALAILARLLGDQQLRLEIGEPRRHHEVVGGEFKPHRPHLFDEFQILVDQRHDRDAGEIDLLVARQMQKQVERPFETVDVDDQRRFAAGARIVVLGPQPVHRRRLARLLVDSRCHACRVSLTAQATASK